MKKRRSSHGLQMFSFLDAMVCTVGALLVLLHAFARHGADEATRQADTLTSAARAELADERQAFEARLAQLNQLKANMQAELDDERLSLSHVEDHQRRLMDRLRELQIAATEMDRNTQGTAQQRQALADQLEALRTQVAAAQKEKDQAKGRIQEQAATYSVVPYEGPNSTHRRPIYIECRESSIVLQPEGVELSPADFAGINGPGNPLASALRGMREYWVRQSPTKSIEEPYPLLLVRPEGIGSYYWAHGALDSWGADFGYELIGADWTLKFPDADPQLRDLAQKIVADSRGRMQELAIASRQLARERQRTGYHASARGGLVPDRTPRNGSGGSGFMGGGTGGFDSLGSNWSKGGSASGGYSQADDGTSGGAGYAGGEFNSGGSRFGESGTGSGRYGTQPGTAGNRSRGMAGRRGTSGYDAANGEEGGTNPYAEALAKSSGSGRSGSSAAGSSARGSSNGGTSNSGTSTAGPTNSGTSSKPGGSSASSSAANANGGSGGSASESMGMGSPSLHASAPTGNKTQSMAKSRGSNWGLPESGVGATGVTRPIRVDCHNDRLVIMPDDNRSQPKEIKLDPQARENMDEFVGAVWQHMKSWGIAGKGFYWKPTLVVEIEPGAADRYAEVKSLLADSGLDVRERTRPQTLAQPPQPIRNR